jgi:HEAT repeat protein
MRLLPKLTLKGACALVVAAAALCATGGCRSLDSPSDLSALGADRSAKPPQAKSADLAESKGSTKEDESVSADKTTESDNSSRPKTQAEPTSDAEADALLVLLEDNWTVEAETVPGAPRASYRWSHAGLDELALAPADKRADLMKLLSSDDPVVSANAAILLARADDSVADLALIESVRDATLRLSLRCASAEALGRPDSVLASIALAELITEYGDPAAPQYSPELHGELLRSLGRQVDAADCPQLAAGLKSASGEVRQAAIEGFASDARAELPRELIAMRADSHPQVRAAVLDCLVARRHPQAQEYCLAALGDVHLSVQLTGIAGLGVLGGEASQRALGRLAVHDSEAVRAAAVAALATIGDEAAVFVAAKDPSWKVRRNVARELARFPTERGSGVARQLLADSNAEVRYGVVEAVGYWSLPQAGPILLTAMSDAPEPTRSQAAQQLTRLWPAAERFSPDAPADLRQDQLRDLQTAWGGVTAGTTITR